MRDDAALATTLERPRLLLRFRVFRHGRALDNELACGASPADTTELALRARQLVEPKRREELASALESLYLHAQRPPSIANTVPVPRRDIIEASADLWAVVERLRDPRPVYAAGVAMISVLLRDGTGPAYAPGRGCALRRALRCAAEALDGARPERHR